MGENEGLRRRGGGRGGTAMEMVEREEGWRGGGERDEGRRKKDVGHEKEGGGRGGEGEEGGRKRRGGGRKRGGRGGRREGGGGGRGGEKGGGRGGGGGGGGRGVGTFWRPRKPRRRLSDFMIGSATAITRIISAGTIPASARELLRDNFLGTWVPRPGREDGTTMHRGCACVGSHILPRSWFEYGQPDIFATARCRGMPGRGG